MTASLVAVDAQSRRIEGVRQILGIESGYLVMVGRALIISESIQGLDVLTESPLAMPPPPAETANGATSNTTEADTASGSGGVTRPPSQALTPAKQAPASKEEVVARIESRGEELMNEPKRRRRKPAPGKK